MKCFEARHLFSVRINTVIGHLFRLGSFCFSSEPSMTDPLKQPNQKVSSPQSEREGRSGGHLKDGNSHNPGEYASSLGATELSLNEPTRPERLEAETDLFGLAARGHPLELFDDVAWDTY